MDLLLSFLDFSFEQAFDKKEKQFMLAYKVISHSFYLLQMHIDTVQQEIDKLKSEANESKYLAMKQEKIKALEIKLRKIRDAAMFLGDLSEKHKQALSMLFDIEIYCREFQIKGRRE